MSSLQLNLSRKQKRTFFVCFFACSFNEMYAIFPWQKLTDSTKIQDDAHPPIPNEQKAAVFNEHGGPIQIVTRPVPSIENDELLVCICYSGVCKMDFQAWQGTLPWKTREKELIGGHKAVGMVVKIGSNVFNYKIGDSVGIKWINGTCMICDFCKSGQEPNCPGVILTGCSRNGTFCQYTTVKETNAVQIPKNVEMPMATVMLCEGLMIYRALKETKVRPGQIISISGAGGSLGKLAIQFASAMGMRILALDRLEKEDICRKLGAEFFVDAFKKDEMFAEIVLQTNGGPHGALSCAPCLSSVEEAIEYVRPHGYVVLTGMPTGSITVNASSIVLRCIKLVGSYVGNRLDEDEVMDFFGRGLVKCETEIYPLNELSSVYERIQKGDVNKHLVLNLQDCE